MARPSDQAGAPSPTSGGDHLRPLRAHYLVSAARLDQCPEDDVAEVAFVGRSNAGKSSVLNRLCGERALARVSRTPGRTQLLNFFACQEGGRIVDLPGYGYASAPIATRQRWQQELERYLSGRPNLRGMVLVTDIRHAMKDTDLHMISWAAASVLPTLVLLNKHDKLGSGARSAALQAARKQLAAPGAADAKAALSVTTFSAQSSDRDNGLGVLLAWVRARLASSAALEPDATP